MSATGGSCCTDDGKPRKTKQEEKLIKSNKVKKLLSLRLTLLGGNVEYLEHLCLVLSERIFTSESLSSIDFCDTDVLIVHAYNYLIDAINLEKKEAVKKIKDGEINYINSTIKKLIYSDVVKNYLSVRHPNTDVTNLLRLRWDCDGRNKNTLSAVGSATGRSKETVRQWEKKYMREMYKVYIYNGRSFQNILELLRQHGTKFFNF